MASVWYIRYMQCVVNKQTLDKEHGHSRRLDDVLDGTHLFYYISDFLKITLN